MSEDGSVGWDWHSSWPQQLLCSSIFVTDARIKRRKPSGEGLASSTTSPTRAAPGIYRVRAGKIAERVRSSDWSMVFVGNLDLITGSITHDRIKAQKTVVFLRLKLKIWDKLRTFALGPLGPSPRAGLTAYKEGNHR